MISVPASMYQAVIANLQQQGGGNVQIVANGPQGQQQVQITQAPQAVVKIEPQTAPQVTQPQQVISSSRGLTITPVSSQPQQDSQVVRVLPSSSQQPSSSAATVTKASSSSNVARKSAPKQVTIKSEKK